MIVQHGVRTASRRLLAAEVIVVGGGNAGLTAAITARRLGASVLLLECASRALRGGNSRHTRDIRFAHEGPSAAATGTYSEAELLDDLLRVTGGATDRRLAELTIRESLTLPEWMSAQGVRWQRQLKGTLHLSRTNGTAQRCTRLSRRVAKSVKSSRAWPMAASNDSHAAHWSSPPGASRPISAGCASIGVRSPTTSSSVGRRATLD
jgi:succinate dehydrogenase/fumarate reductase flavoprotein subunit